jgi:uncharacterized protein YqjF (DUF2071 family)
VIWLQHWDDVVFLHFPLPERQLRPLVPSGVAIDTYGGSAWLSYIFFRLNLRPAWLPNIPGFSSLYELNVRTYVRHRDQPGIYFLRMYADNPLKYEVALIRYERRSDGSRRIACQPRSLPSSIELEFRIADLPPIPVAANSLDHWLLERYRAFVPRPDQSLLTATVEHPPWQAAPVELIRYDDDLRSALGLQSDARPALMHHSLGLAARFNAFQTAADPEIVDETAHGKEKHYKDKVAGTGFEPATSRL